MFRNFLFFSNVIGKTFAEASRCVFLELALACSSRTVSLDKFNSGKKNRGEGGGGRAGALLLPYPPLIPPIGNFVRRVAGTKFRLIN